MKKFIFKSFDIYANSEEEAWENIQESLQENEISVCFTVSEIEISLEDFKSSNPLNLNNELLDNLTESNFRDYLNENQ